MKQVFSFVLLLFLVAGMASYAQNPYFGVKAGLNLSHMVLKNNDTKFTNALNISPGFNAGLTMDYRIIPELTINASLLISNKGYLKTSKEDFQGASIKSIERLSLYYVEFPLYVKYEFQLGMVDVFAGAGPFVSYGYWGKYRWQRKGGGETEWGKSDVLWGENPEEDDFVNLDYGAGITVGGKWNNFVLDIGYHYSIPNISANTENGMYARNGVLFASVSYFFSRFYKYAEGNF